MVKKKTTPVPAEPVVQIRDRIKELRRVPAADLAPNPRNWRTHPERQREALRGILEEVGYAGALLARELPDGSLELIDGHLRVGMTPEAMVPVLVLDVDEHEAAKLLATFDPISAMAGTNGEALDALLRDVSTGTEALADMLAELADDAGLYQAAVEIVEDEAPEPPEDPITRPGDLWLLGKHRLLCGDSTNAEDVARVMHGERAGLMNTDPPYGISYANDEHPNHGAPTPRVANDDLADAALQQFLENAFHAAVDQALAPNAAWYLWHAHLTQGYFAAAAAAAAAANVVLHRQIIWVKPVLVFGRGQYHWKHEPCFMGWVKGQQPPDYGLGNGERTQTTIWAIDGVSRADRKEFNHSTPKPIGLFAIPIVKHLVASEICFEPFAGSGPQFIAAEQLNRRCFGLELSPANCDVIVARWEKLTGEKASLEASDARP
jgi:DNA modification methylase